MPRTRTWLGFLALLSWGSPLPALAHATLPSAPRPVALGSQVTTRQLLPVEAVVRSPREAIRFTGVVRTAAHVNSGEYRAGRGGSAGASFHLLLRLDWREVTGVGLQSGTLFHTVGVRYFHFESGSLPARFTFVDQVRFVAEEDRRPHGSVRQRHALRTLLLPVTTQAEVAGDGVVTVSVHVEAQAQSSF